jgi:hypothetical protein
LLSLDAGLECPFLFAELLDYHLVTFDELLGFGGLFMEFVAEVVDFLKPLQE